MTQHGTSVVIKQTNDGLGSAERQLKMLQVVARDQKTQETEAETSSIHFPTVHGLSGLCLSQKDTRCMQENAVNLTFA